MLLQDFFWNTLKALTRVDFLNSALLSLPALCCLPFCSGSLVPVGKQQKDQDIPGASSEAGLHYCMCENLVLVAVALDGGSDPALSQRGPVECSGPASCVKGPWHSHSMRPSRASASLQLSNSHPWKSSLWATCSSALHPHPSGGMIWCSLWRSFLERDACSDQHSGLLRKT